MAEGQLELAQEALQLQNPARQSGGEAEAAWREATALLETRRAEAHAKVRTLRADRRYWTKNIDRLTKHVLREARDLFDDCGIELPDLTAVLRSDQADLYCVCRQPDDLQRLAQVSSVSVTLYVMKDGTMPPFLNASVFAEQVNPSPRQRCWLARTPRGALQHTHTLPPCWSITRTDASPAYTRQSQPSHQHTSVDTSRSNVCACAARGGTSATL